MNQQSKIIVFALMCFAVPLPLFSQVPVSQKLDQNMSLQETTTAGIKWYDPRVLPFELVGFEWIGEDDVYRRLPVKPEWEIRDAVDQLADHTAGGQVRFRTDSRRILVRVALQERSGMYHMPATGQSGFDLYVQDGNIQRYVRTTRFPHDTLRYEVELNNENEPAWHSYTVNFPLYNGVKSLEIGLDEEASLEAPPAFRVEGKIVIYGTSITQGGCVSRPGMAYSNTISRKLDVRFVNLGFSGNGRGEPELAHLINQIEGIRMIILDYEANANETIVHTIGPFVDILRDKRPEVPILIMSKIRYASAVPGSPADKLLVTNRDFQEKMVKDRRAMGDDNIYFLDGSTVLGDDYFECTVDGSHPTDLGSLRIANALIPEITNILGL